MKIWTISDTHSEHSKLILPDPTDIDMVIHSGDASCYNELSYNDAEMRKFLTWYNNLPYKYKIYVPGNHETSVERGYHNFKDYPNIIVLIHESIEIEGIKIFGSPYTPSFGIGWAYNVSRHKIDTYWEKIPENTDILITHGPPKGILDYTARSNNLYEQAGCSALLNNIIRINPKYHIFGHLHNEKNVMNCGIFKSSNNKLDTFFINACIVDLNHNIVNNGMIIELN